MFFPLLAAITIQFDFEGGSLSRVEKVSEFHFRAGAKGEKDQDGRNRQASYYYFRVDGALPGVPLNIDVVDLPGEYNYKPNRGAITKDTPPVIRFDGGTWQHVTDFEYDAEEPKLRLKITPKTAKFWIAHVPPYTNQDLSALRSRIAKSAEFREEVIGKSAGGRDLYLWTIGKARSANTIWLMFRQHSWETGSSWAGEGAVSELLRDAALRNGVTWKILPLCDPDGVARGGVRFNVNGFDLNRNWDVDNAAKMPEIHAQRSAVKKWLDGGGKIDLFYSLHNTETSEYLEGPPGGSEFRALAQRLFAELGATSFHPSRPLFFSQVSTTAGMPGRMNVIQGLYRDFKIPGFLMEQRISFNEKLGRLPTAEDRMKFGAELVRAMWRTVTAD